jgi:hypothetical protein
MPFSIRYLLSRLGEHLSQNQIHALKATVKYLDMGSRMRPFGYRLAPRSATREELFDLVGREVGDRKVLYLEFGVYVGVSMRYWSQILRHPETKLHGFDSFEGLPEHWNETRAKGHFSTNGVVPDVDDERVKFITGWFEETLPGYQPPEHDVLVLMIDADLYSSAKCIFDHVGRYIVPGTYVYFDEFSDLEHEFRAFMEFSASSARKFVVRGATHHLLKALFQCVA